MTRKIFDMKPKVSESITQFEPIQPGQQVKDAMRIFDEAIRRITVIIGPNPIGGRGEHGN